MVPRNRRYFYGEKNFQPSLPSLHRLAQQMIRDYPHFFCLDRSGSESSLVFCFGGLSKSKRFAHWTGRSDQIRSDHIISYHIISYHIISEHIRSPLYDLPGRYFGGVWSLIEGAMIQMNIFPGGICTRRLFLRAVVPGV